MLLVIFVLLSLKSYGFQLKCFKSFSLLQQRLKTNYQLHYNINDFINDNNAKPSFDDIQLYFRSMNEKSNHLSISETIILVDLTVRSFDDLEEFQDVEYKKLSIKCKNLKNDISKDKFLYSYDLSTTDRKVSSIARIPSEMYQKLDLSKRLSDLHTSNSIIVYMLSGNGEIIVDKDMCDAILSGFQLKSLASSMPNMKKSMKSPTINKSDKEKLAIEFILPSLHQENLYLNNNKDNNIDNNKDSSSITDLNYQIKDIPNVTDKISALEAAMLQATLKNRFRESSDTPTSNTNNNNNNNKVKPSVVPIMYRDAELKKYLSEIMIVNQGTHLTRQLSSLPPNVLNPSSYSLYLQSLAKANNWVIEEWDANTLKEIGCGAFYAVTQADTEEPQRVGRLVRLSSYPSNNMNKAETSSGIQNTLSSLSSLAAAVSNGNKNSNNSKDNIHKPIVLVGKGVCYDTGGINVKSASTMKGMKIDMAGSATALSTFIALQSTEIKDIYPIECWLAIAENNMNINAFRPDDVVYAVTGDSIEVVHTDAEGRMLLADTLALATRSIVNPRIHTKQSLEVTTPKIVVDFATLTGTCITSLSNRYIGAFTNRKEFIPTIIETGVCI